MITWVIVGATVCSVDAVPGSARAQDAVPGFRERITRLARDGAYVAAAPLRLGYEDILPILVVGGAIGATIAYDDEIRDRLAPLRRWGGRGSLVTTGDVLQFGGLIAGAGMYAYGSAADDPRAIDHAWLQADGAIWSLAVNEMMRYAIGRERPDAHKGDHSFHPFSGADSLPSGHATPAFTAAMLLAEEYPSWPVRLAAFGGATAVGLSRIADDKHWAGDVLVSAALGIGIAHALYTVHARPSDNWQLTADGGMIRLARRF